MRRRRAHAVVVVTTAADGSISLTVAAAFNDYKRAADLVTKLERAAERRNDIDEGTEHTVHCVPISSPTIKEMIP